ncbi:MAG: hypothetical protein EU532_05760 [Promethearchaeota archaeon]|nr:MAG: hypothetical protein EU532_05760 [Candidatus Lokiarchaeota archaeon]
MPTFGHICYGLALLIPILYYTKTDEKPFNYKVAFIFLTNNIYGPDLVGLFFVIPTHNILGFLIMALPLAVFFSYFSRFSLKKSEGKFPLKFVDDGISEVNYKNAFCITAAGGISHFFIDQFYHWEKKMQIWPGIAITHDEMLAWGGPAYHYITPLIILGDIAIVSYIVLSLYTFMKGHKETFKLLLISTLVTLSLMVFISTSIFWAEREIGAIVHCFVYVLIPLFLLMYAARDVKDNPITTPDIPKINRKTLLKIVVIISILFALFMAFYAYFAITYAGYLAELIIEMFGGNVAEMTITVTIIGYIYMTFAIILLIASIGLFFKSNICRYIVMTICTYFLIFVFPFAITLFLCERDVKAMFGKESEV